MKFKSNYSSLIYNGTITSGAISAAFELGLLEVLKKSEKPVLLSQFCNQQNLDYQSLKAIIYTMSCFNIVQLDKETDEITPGAHFQEIYDDQGYFYWMMGGYGGFLNRFADLSRVENRKGNYFSRDGAAIALSGRNYGSIHVDPFFEQIIQNLDFKKVADLGCGSAERLIQIVRRRKQIEGVGIEVNSQGAAVARRNVQDQQLQNRIEVVESDVARLEPHPAFESVELITSFFMGHDLWPRENCIAVFRNFLSVFPQVKYFVFCDTYRSNEEPKQNLPTFTLGYEVFHTLMGQHIPSLEDWYNVFSVSGWKAVAHSPVGIPFTRVFVLSPESSETSKEVRCL